MSMRGVLDESGPVEVREQERARSWRCASAGGIARPLSSQYLIERHVGAKSKFSKQIQATGEDEILIVDVGNGIFRDRRVALADVVDIDEPDVGPYEARFGRAMPRAQSHALGVAHQGHIAAVLKAPACIDGRIFVENDVTALNHAEDNIGIVT